MEARGVRMVEISGKEEVVREAVAEGFIKLRRETVERIRRGEIEKGDVVAIAQIAGIQAVKRTWDIVPLCHPIPITGVDVRVEVLDDGVRVVARVRTVARTGVEMEAITGTAAALIAVWDVVKKYEKDERGQYPHTRIEWIRVVRKEKRSASRG